MPTISPAAKGWIWNLPSDDLADVFGDGFGAAVDGVERLRKARGQAPFDLGHGLRDRGLRDRRGRKADAGRLQELTTFHSGSPPPCAGLPSGPALPGLAIRPATSPFTQGQSSIKVVLTFRRHRGPRALAAAWTAGRAACQAAAPGAPMNTRSIFAVSACCRVPLVGRTAEEARDDPDRDGRRLPALQLHRGQRAAGFRGRARHRRSARRRRRGAPSSIHEWDGMIKGLLRERVRCHHGLARHHREAPGPYRLLEALLPHSGRPSSRARTRDIAAVAPAALAGKAHRHDRRQPARPLPRGALPRRGGPDLRQARGREPRPRRRAPRPRARRQARPDEVPRQPGRPALLPARRRRALRSRLLPAGVARRAAQGATPSLKALFDRAHRQR